MKTDTTPIGDHLRKVYPVESLHRSGNFMGQDGRLAIFFASGFYTRGRMYQSRYKVIVVFQAVTASYLTFGFLSYFLGGALAMAVTAAIGLLLGTSVG